MAVAAAVAVCGLTAAAARADTVTLNGTPLNVSTDGFGGLQFRYDGQSDGTFFDPEADPGHAGLAIKEGASYYPVDDGFSGAPGRTRYAGPTVTSPAPGTQLMHTVYTVGPDLSVSEDITYADGQTSVAVHYAITNVAAAPVSLRAGELADLYVGDNDQGSGVYSAGPPRFVGGRAQSNGLVTGLTEATPWASFQEGDFGSVFDNFSADGLDGKVDGTPAGDPAAPDNGVGVEYRLDNLAPGETRAIDLRWLLDAPAPPGSGPPPPGIAATSTTPASTLPPPVAGKTVNVKLARGKVKYKKPGSKTFVNLTEDVQLPVGTLFDTTAGRITLTTAADLKGATQHAWFYDGIFTVAQQKAAKPVTELALPKDKLACKAATAAAKAPKSRKLWGDGAGSFRTRGQFSSATVRGTKWVVIDRCDGTLTRVVRGVVRVDDLVTHKTVTVRAGKQYLARKPK